MTLTVQQIANQLHIQKSKQGYLEQARPCLSTDSWSNISMAGALLAITSMSKTKVANSTACSNPLNVSSPQNAHYSWDIFVFLVVPSFENFKWSWSH